MTERDRDGLGCTERPLSLALVVAIGLVACAGCQGFPGTIPRNPTGILGDDVLTTAVTGMTPVQESQLKQHRLSLQIKNAGGDVNLNMALYPASTIIGVDLHQTRVTDADLAQLGAFPNLRILNLYDTQITDAGLENLAALRGLQTLHLAYTGVSDAGLLALQKLPDLRDLGLTHTKVSDRGMTTLANMKTLTELTLSGNQITDAGLMQLRSLSKLRKLVLIKTNVSKTAIEQFQKALPDVHVFAG